MAAIHPLEPIGVIVLAAILIYMRRKQKQKETGGAKGATPAASTSRPRDTPEEVYMKLRRRALETTAGNLGIEEKVNEPYGLLMEMGIQSSVVTLVCLSDGDASLYYKTGGGMTGGISHESVRNAAKELVGLARKPLSKMTRTTDYPLPGPDKVRFYALTPQGIFTTETSRQALASPQNELARLFASGQEVVAQMRQVQEDKAAALTPRGPVPGIDPNG
jgi:hypothetical protein